MTKRVEKILLVMLFAFAIYSSLTIGSFWDETWEMTLGKDRLKYLFSLGTYKYLSFYKYEEFYPGIYNTIAIFFTKMFPIKYEVEIWRLTHLLFSILTIFGIYRISSNLFNKNIGKIAFLICFINPTFFGHAIMNSKDTIVAFSYVWSTYIFLRYLQTQNIKKKTNKYTILGGLSLGLGMGVRFPFLISLAPLFIFFLIDVFFTKKIICKNFSIKKSLLDILKIFVISYLVAISCWPQVYGNIFIEPFKLMLELASFQGAGVPWILFNGDIFSTIDLPKTYILINLFYKSPEFILFGFLFFVFAITINTNFFKKEFKYLSIKIFLIVLVIFFPLIFFLFLPYRVYDGIRLFLYIVPFISIIPSILIYYLIKTFSTLTSKFLTLTLALLIAHYVYIFVSLTPYQYTYLNNFNGNFSSAHYKFENDYFATSIKELVKKISNENNLFPKDREIKIAFCGVNHKNVMNELDKINLKYKVENLLDGKYEYLIMTNRVHVEQASMKKIDVKSCYERFTGKNIINVERNGLILSTLRKKI